MGWKDYVVPPAFQKKTTEVHRAIVRMMGLQPQWSKRNYENFSKEGYAANVWVFRCVQAIAQGAAMVPWILYRVDSKGNRQELPGHELLKLLDRPNEFTSRQEFFEAFAAYALISGNSYMDMISPFEGTPPKELWIYRPDRMSILTDSNKYVGGYQYDVGAEKVKLDRDRIAHLKFFSPIDDYYGLGPLQIAARGIDNDNAANAWNNSLLNNGGRPSGALMTPDVLTENQYDNLKRELDNNIAGAKNAGKPILLEGGLTWQNMSMSPMEMDFISSKKMSILEICAAFGVPPEIVGYGENKTYSNYQEARKALYEDAVVPMLNRIADKLNSALVPRFGEDLLLLPNLDSIEALQENRDSVYKRAGQAHKDGLLMLDEAREEIGYGKAPGGKGQEFYKPPVKEPQPKEQEPEGGEGKTKQAGFFLSVKALNITTEEQKTLYWKAQEEGREKFYEGVAKEVAKEFEIERKAVLKAFENGGMDAVEKVLKARQKDWAKLFTAIYVQVMDAFGNALMQQFKKDAGVNLETKAPLIPLETIFKVFDKAVQKFIASTVAKKVVGISLVTEKKIRNIIKMAEAAGASIEDIAKRIDGLYLDQIIPNRSEVIARTEVISASNAGNAYAADQTGLKLKKTWLATRDERTRETHDTVDGQERPKTDYYDVGNVQLLFPGDPEGIAETEKDLAKEVIQCRCTEVYEVIK